MKEGLVSFIIILKLHFLNFKSGSSVSVKCFQHPSSKCILIYKLYAYINHGWWQKWPKFSLGKNKCQLLRIDNLLGPWECLLDLNDNWSLFQFPMRDSCNPGSESYPRILPHTFCTWPYITPSTPRLTWAHVFSGSGSTSLKYCDVTKNFLMVRAIRQWNMLASQGVCINLTHLF